MGNSVYLVADYRPKCCHVNLSHPIEISEVIPETGIGPMTSWLSRNSHHEVQNQSVGTVIVIEHIYNDEMTKEGKSRVPAEGSPKTN